MVADSASNAVTANLEYICVTPPETVQGMLEALARARGCRTDEEVAEFLSPLPPLRSPLEDATDLAKGVDRVLRAIANNEAITVFGDYDCDGVTSCAQWVNLLRAAGHTRLRVYIPDRFVEDYGLTPPAVESCLEQQNPSLIIAVDCGSTAIEALRLLRSKNIDVIVIDHHQVHQTGDHPSYAHLNPKGDRRLTDSRSLQDAANMSAAGLVFFVCDAVARKGHIDWDRDANLLLAGLGTYVDVMPLIGTNRALVKHSLALINSAAVDRVPGIKALLAASDWRKPVTDYAYGFVLGPCINATGRLAHAKTSLNLVCSRGAKCEQYALELVQANTDRKKIQNSIVQEALAQAKQILQVSPDAKVLTVYGKDWHTGIVGIVAGKVREQTGVPTIAMARLENGFWKGSGRSVQSFDIGAFVKKAVDAGLLTGGGGHAVACGVKLTDAQLGPFVAWVTEESAKASTDLRPLVEIIGDADWFGANEWAEFFERASPYGNGNPRPALEILNPTRLSGPERKERADGTVWALGAELSTPTHSTLNLTWTDATRAESFFSVDRPTRFIAEFDRQQKYGRCFNNWRVIHAEFTK